MLKRAYKRFFNRSMSLLAVETWFAGEYSGLRKLTNNQGRFNPLFKYQQKSGVSVYYDMNDPSTDDEPIIQYFLSHPTKFKKLAGQFKEDCLHLLYLTNSISLRNCKKFFELQSAAFSKLSMLMLIGNLYESDKKNDLATLAYMVRKQTVDIYYESENRLYKFLEKNLSPVRAKYLHFIAIRELVSGKIPSEKILKERSKAYIYYRGQIYAGRKLRRFAKIKRIQFLKEGRAHKESIQILTGNIAVSGKTRGRVKIVLDFSSLNKVRRGDILVTAMTTPDFISAMKKAAAFVTDEGGIMCHAAIVAREYKKPCIIGTKIATQVLRDGDLVEVDANNGRVKLLER